MVFLFRQTWAQWEDVTIGKYHPRKHSLRDNQALKPLGYRIKYAKRGVILFAIRLTNILF